MLKAIAHRRGDESDQPFGTLALDAGERHLRRKQIVTNQGDKVLVDLPEPALLADGDVLVLEDGRVIEIIATREKLYEVLPGAAVPLSHLAWHLGNRHQAAQIDADRILIRRDHVIRDMLLGLGATVSETIERFQPLHGAYHSHGHAHDDHGHHDDHGKPDRYGRLPGDPHYGHNHG